MSFLISQVNDGIGLPLPAYQTAGSAGMDLYAAITEEITINPLDRILVPMGIQLSLEAGYEAQIRPRSGLALTHGITILNSPGTIDSDYRGEIQVIIYNASQTPFTIKRGERVAQMVICPVIQIDFKLVSELSLDDTSRGQGGFGHTGK